MKIYKWFIIQKTHKYKKQQITMKKCITSILNNVKLLTILNLLPKSFEKKHI